MPTYDVLRSRDPALPSRRTPLPASTLAEVREQIVQELGVHFANADIARRELERRLGLVFGASSLVTLEELVADLPPLGGDLRPTAARVSTSPHEGGAERAVLAAVMGATIRKGSWRVPRRVKVVAIMGAGEIDLRQAEFAPGVTDIEVFVFMGAVDVLLPHGVQVETVGMAVMGAFEAHPADPGEYPPGQPVVRLSGLAIMGAVEARAKRPSTKALQRFRALVEKVRAREAKKSNG